MKKEEENIDIYYIMKPMTYFAKICGLWPHTVKRSFPGVSTAGLLWYFVVFGVYIYVFYLNLDKTFWEKFLEVSKSEIQTYGNWMQVLSGLLIGMISLVIAMCTFRKQWLFFEMVDGVDDILNKEFSVISPKKIYRALSIFTVILMLIIMNTLTIVTYYVYNAVVGVNSFKICFSTFMANLPYSCIILIFYMSCLSLTRRFTYINKILLQLSPHNIPKNTFELCSRTTKNDRHKPTIALNEIYSIYGGQLKKMNPMSPPSKNYKTQNDIKREITKLTAKLERNEESLFTRFQRRNVIEVEEFKLSKMTNVDDIIEHLTKLLDIHDIILDCISLQNEILSFQVLLIVAQIFVFEVVSFFSLYRTVYNNSANSNALAVGNLFWLILYNSILYFIMSPATECIKAGKLTGTYCHKIINKISSFADPKVIEKLSVMSHQLTMRTPNITCGLFSFDWELLFSIISATSIYLVFLIQFDIAGNAANRAQMA